jgi:hypothetical protein
LKEAVQTEKESVVNCIFCGLHVDPEVAVRYQGWISHPECAKSTMTQRIERFDRRYFILGALGAVIGLVFAFLIAGAQAAFAEPIVPDYIFMTHMVGIGLLGISVGFLIHSIGLFGLYRNYLQVYARTSAILSVLVACCFGYKAFLLLTYGLDPLYHDPETGHLLLIPNYYLAGITSVMLFGILSVLVAITVWMLEDELRGGFVSPMILGILLVIIGALVLYSLPMIALYFVVIFLIFTTAGIPKYWIELEK